MPLLLEQNMPYNGTMGVWRIRESATELLDRLTLDEEEKQELSLIKGEGRRREWLAARLLIHHIVGSTDRLPLRKDEYGKPYIASIDRYLTLSHSDDMAAAMIADIPCGIDIQKPVDKIRRLVPKYCSAKETKAIYGSKALETMHIIWGAKECMYKAYGKRALDYRKHLYVLDARELMIKPTTGRLKKNKFVQEYEIGAEYVLDYILTYCFEKND